MQNKSAFLSLHADRPTGISLMRPRHHVVLLSFALLVMLNFDRSTVKHALQNMQSDATSGFLTALECTKFVLGRGSAPDPIGGAYCLQGLLLRGGREEEGRKGKKRGEEGEGIDGHANANSWLRSKVQLYGQRNRYLLHLAISTSTRLQSVCCTKSFFSMDVLHSSTSSTPWPDLKCPGNHRQICSYWSPSS